VLKVEFTYKGVYSIPRHEHFNFQSTQIKLHLDCFSSEYLAAGKGSICLSSLLCCSDLAFSFFFAWSQQNAEAFNPFKFNFLFVPHSLQPHTHDGKVEGLGFSAHTLVQIYLAA